jgi:hypothetical protein
MKLKHLSFYIYITTSLEIAVIQGVLSRGLVGILDPKLFPQVLYLRHNARLEICAFLLY